MRMFDSTTPNAIPTTAEAVAGYVDGAYKWTDADWSRFPTAARVRVAVFASTDDGDVLDVENGDATPAQAPGWVQMRRASRAAVQIRPADSYISLTIYCNSSTWPSVRRAFQTDGVAEPDYWIAQWDGAIEIPAGAVAKQYATPPDTLGNYDLSVTVDSWPLPPLPPPQPQPQEDDVQPFIAGPATDGKTYLVAGDMAHKVWITGPANEAALKALGYATVPLSPDQLDVVPTVVP